MVFENAIYLLIYFFVGAALPGAWQITYYYSII
jgi:hypothetical protein